MWAWVDSIIEFFKDLFGVRGRPGKLQPGEIYSYPLDVSQWMELNGHPVYNNGNGITVDFPQTTWAALIDKQPCLNYIICSTKGLSGQKLRVTFKIEATPGTVFNYRTNPNNQSGPGYPGVARMFMQRKGDNWGAEGVYQQYRYWYVPKSVNLSSSTLTLEVDFNPANWSDIYAAKGSQYPDRFAACMKEAAYVGITLGGGSFYGHGVNTIDGTAKITILELTISN